MKSWVLWWNSGFKGLDVMRNRTGSNLDLRTLDFP